MRILSNILLSLAISLAAHSLLQAQSARTISAVQIEETNEGTLLTIGAEQPLPYIRREDERGFQIIIPRVSESSAFQERFYAGKLVSIQIVRHDVDAVFILNAVNHASINIKNDSSNDDRQSFNIKILISSKTNENRDNSPSKSNQSETYSPLVVGKKNTPIIANSNHQSLNSKTSQISETQKINTEIKNTDSANLPLASSGTKNGLVTPTSLQITRVKRAPVLDSFINKNADNKQLPGTEVTDFRQLTPEDGAPATQSTKAYVSYDDSNLYVVFVCRADRKKIRAHMAKREDIFGDDMVSVVLDTFHDRRRAYVFSANPLGVQLDAINTEGQGSDYSFDTLWYSEGRLTNDGFVVSMQIPFKSLRFSSDSIQSWGIALGRTIAENNEDAYYPHITERKQGFVQQAARLEGLEKISTGRNVQIIPYYVASTERSLDVTPDNTPYFRNRRGVRVGMDAKIVLKNALTLDLTVNPDFSQVESDEPQVTINRRFETFFPEKRPFFIENAGFFVTPENLFFSRRIADPQFGARLTGKIGKWAIGGLLIDDKAPGRFFSLNQYEYGKRASAGVFRLQRELGDQSSIGMLLTDYRFASGSNTVFSIDSRFKLNENWSFSGQFVRSFTKEREGIGAAGSAYIASLSRSGRKFNYDLTYTDRSPDFDAQLGFIPRVDVRQIEQNASYRWRPNKKGIVSFGPSGYASVNWNHEGKTQDWYLNGGFRVEFTGLTGVNFSKSKSYELFLGQGFHTENNSVYFYSDRLDWLGISGSYVWGSSINYAPPVNLNPFKASSSGASFDLTLRPSSRLSLKQTYIYSRLMTITGINILPGISETKTQSIFYNHLFRSKLNYQFNRRLSLRAIVDYNAILPNSTLIELERTKRLTGDILVTYMINPWTAVNVGYTDTYENLLISEGAPAILLRASSPFNPVGRRFFIKFNNLIRF